MHCCARCFGDRALEKLIADQSDRVGTCSYCGSAEVPLISPRVLETHFATLISVYEPDSKDGKPLTDLLMRDWRLFEHPKMDALRARALLTDILDDGDIVRLLFVFSPTYNEDGLHLRWNRLRDELMSKNRYFPEAAVDYDRLEALLVWLEADGGALPNLWYRARVTQGDSALAIEQMGAPPAWMSSHGRANPAGIPYLYLGSTETTAVAEIRPHAGECVSVAEFTIAQGLRLIDLRDPRKLVSPFFFDSEAEIAALHSDMPFIERLGGELTRPVLPQRAAIDYVPSQYLCEFIKKVGYDGVVYRSSVGDGINLALFNPATAIGGKVTARSVLSVTVTIQ